MNQNSPLSFSNIFKRETKLAAYFIICLTLVVLSVSYALFFSVDDNTNDQVVTAGDLKFTYKNGQAISSSSSDNAKNICFQPMSDEEAELYWNECSYNFSVTNTGTLSANYSLSLSAMNGNGVSADKLKVILRTVESGETKKTESGFPKSMNSLDTIEDTGENAGTKYSLLKNIELGAKKTAVYQVQIYIDEKAYTDDLENQEINYQIEGTGIVHETEDIDPDIPFENPFENPTETVDEAGNGLYKVEHNDAEIDGGGVVGADGWKKTEWRYGGPDPNNYVWFNCEEGYPKEGVEDNASHCEKWRIIGLVNVQTKSGITQRLKIVKGSEVASNYWDNESPYKNDWTKASLMKKLNEIDGIKGEYYETLKDAAINMISEDIIWNIGGTGTRDTKEDGLAKHFYGYERGTSTGNSNTYPSTWPAQQEDGTYENVIARVGLIYPSDYGYAVGGTKENRATCLDKEMYNWSKVSDCKNNDWLKSLGTTWTISPYSDDDDFAFSVGSSGCVGSNVGYSNVGVAPVVYLSSKVSITDGKGTEDSPYILTVE